MSSYCCTLRSTREGVSNRAAMLWTRAGQVERRIDQTKASEFTPRQELLLL